MFIATGHFRQNSRRYMVVLHDHNNTVLYRQLDGTANGRAVTETHTKRRGIVVPRKNYVRNSRRRFDNVFFQSKYIYMNKQIIFRDANEINFTDLNENKLVSVSNVLNVFYRFSLLGYCLKSKNIIYVRSFV